MAKTRRVAKKQSAKKRPRTATKTARRKSAARAVASRSTGRKSAQVARKKSVSKKTVSKKTASRTKKTTAPRSRMARAASTVRGAVAGAVQRIAGSFPWAADENDPIALLESDHRRFESLLKEGEETTDRAVKGRTQLLDTLTATLNVHELIEEKILYPALKPHTEARDVVLEGFEEHHVADLIVKELHDLAKDDEQWGAKLKVLKESIEHHIKEEEGTMFPVARKVLSAGELRGLGVRMRALKRQEERRSSRRRNGPA